MGTSAWADPIVVGETDNSTDWWTAFSDYYTLAPNQTVTLKFKNYSGKEDNAHNWLAVVTNDVDRNDTDNGYVEYVVLRADNWGWGANYESGTLTSNYNWDNFRDHMDGSDVVMTIERKGATVTINADITASDGETKYNEKFVVDCGTGTQTIRAFLTTQKGHLEISSAEITDTDGVMFPTTKMTYVDGEDENADVAYGEIAEGEVAKAGYNRISGGAVALGNKGWHCNWITYLQVNASALPKDATITNVTLSFDQSGSTDSKRTTGVGAGYNSSEWSAEMTYNTADKSITTLGDVVWTSTKSATVYERKSIDITAAFSGDADNIVTILLYETAAAGCYIKNPVVTISYTEEKAYNVTFAETNSVEATVKIGGADVTAGTILPNGTYDFTATAFGYEDYKGQFTVTDADKNVVFTMTEKDKIDYTLTAVDAEDNELLSLDGGWVYSGETATFYVPYYIFKEGKFYTNPVLSEGTLSYAQGSLAGITEDKDISVTYTEEENTNVVFFSEAENLSGVTPYGDGYTQIRMSNGMAGYYAEAAAFTTLAAGTYTITASTRAGKTTFYAGTVGEGTQIYEISSSGSVVTTTSDSFTLTEATDIYTSVGDSKAYFDYVIIREIKPVSVEVSAAGWATLYTPYAIDFSGVEGLTAYTATLSESTVTLTAVKDVPANTGVVLKAAEGKYDIPVIASSETAKGDLQGSAEATAWDAFADNTLYILTMNGDKAQFNPVVSGEIAAGKAFLKVAKTSEVQAFSVVFADETTGIETMRNVENEKMSNAVFDLSGRRVAKAQKGVYIVNGKKVVK